MRLLKAFLPVSVVMATLRLPIAPSMKIYCVYGNGKDTEVCHFAVTRRGL